MDEIVMKHKDDADDRNTITVPKANRAFWEKQGYVLVEKQAPVAHAKKEE